MNSRLVIKDFGPIKSADLDLRRYSLFIGTQASGKSTIAKLIAIFKDIELVIVEGADFKQKFLDYNLSNFFTPSTYLNYSNENYAISYKNEKFSMKKESKYAEKIEQEKIKIYAIIDNHIKSQSRSIGEVVNTADYREQLYVGNWKNLIGLQVEQTYIPAERMLMSLVSENPFSLLKNFSLPTCVFNFGQKFEQAKRVHPEFPIDFLNIIYKTEEGKQRVYYEGNKFLDLSESASGFQAIIPVLMVVKTLSKSKPFGSFVIEEPELNLFPTTQKQLVDFIVTNLNESPKGGELVITTHSPYILSSLNILLLAYVAAKRNPDNIKEIEATTPSKTWIDPSEFNAFHFSNGEVKEIFDRENNIISQNELDEISETIGDVFNDLMDLYQKV